MISLLKMPKLSPTMKVGTIIKWHKQSNEQVHFGDVLIEISTDKAVVEHTATEDGWIRQLLFHEGDKVSIGTPIAIFSTQPDELFDLEELLPKKQVVEEKSSPISSEFTENVPPIASQSHSPNLMAVMGFKPEPPLTTPLTFKNPNIHSKLSPLAKHLAKEKNLDVSSLQGSGPGGRIVKKDLDKAPRKHIGGFGYLEAPDIPPGFYQEENLSPIREIISPRLQAAKTFIPHFYVRQQIYATPLLNLLHELQVQGIKISINDSIIRACALALKEFPEINSGFNSVDNKIIRFKTIDISIAVAIPDGVITPIIRCADCKNIGMISAEIKNLVEKARNQSLQETEYKGGSFCISNLGMTGITEFTAIINPPQAAILAVGSIVEQPIVLDEKVAIGSTCILSLSIDHRVIDGYPAAMFMKRLQKILEAPAVLLLN
ncbi:pyruvate dehydrogenase complex dihydrolipoamide acetyltransferase [Candidatus Chlamydia sanziniae]|uniref:Acetyltransferase component of pyruvate dehydrogenase complex n=1 Tax=Candidatus Chlamydia sanziniae TaxID=1806891 RepID=A0A1A9HVM4_9CHLA|nr:pyruvate dehydrogenase complex dihydrolipoamide acetyltransferase [Candidatus Chlamydia sanziniae]ANH79049.1 Dihydrolipoamide acetyltransferase component of pyruvate dehydrogenase complex [Candidatus Chlamydia sanziniae]